MKSGFFLGLTLPLLLAMAVNAYGLTTFGKTQNGNVPAPQPPQPPVVRGRECQFEKDCQAIANTSCVEDPLEPKTSRCLCGDNKAPVNGACNNKHKEVNHSCMKSEECREGSECKKYKEGGNRGVDKVCKCSEGFLEIDFSCSGGSRISDISVVLVVAVVISFIAVTSATSEI